MLDFQASLLDLNLDRVALGALRGRVERRELSDGAWVDLRRGWLCGADEVFADLVHDVPWQAERRPMYDDVVAVPRLLCHYAAGDLLPHPILEHARDTLSSYYADELGEPFVTAGCCYYRDGHDSVAWHGDRIGRGRSADTMVAILSLGSPRRLSLRPVGGTTAAAYPLGHGDLIVMGGSCQRTWEHAILKTARPVGPRISIQFRPRNVF
ncbi:alpha-ketoglutarate-dependent dioxygenase AlkB [Nocardioides mangrovicus]|uniref:Alpha-ketoglutarate-dependent dioxygenase AlkB n=1 Tax=Nocardioides mangrovicus TaxID=2478913 RepID=A0A3L8NYE0_9ACTN|nr:alpha-ketoglutarate-dependent dioxygenase AlkB [Nocardioides mangrovicus]RLV47563.1 alpha-ketoglutarate-dependent dioxygenase AlkB [Nocardioides mangrovicus]